MNKLVLKIYDYMASHKIMSVSTFAIITSLLVFSFIHLGYKEDISDFLPLDEEQQEALRIYQDISGASRVFVIFEFKDSANFDYDKLIEAVDEYVDYAQSNDTCGYIKELTYKIDDTKISEITDFIYGNIPFFLDADDYEMLDSLVSTPDFVKMRLKETKQLLMLPTGGLFTENVQKDPLNIFTPAISELSKSSPQFSIDSYDGYILTPDSKRMVVAMNSPFGNSETENNSKLVSLLESAKEYTVNKNPLINIRIAGGPVIAVENSAQIKTDSVVSILITVVLIVALLFYCFKSIRNILLIVLSISWGWLFAIAGLALFHDKISIIVIGISSVILGIAVNYPLHLIAHLSHTTSVRKALREIVAPLIIGNITTVSAFCTLIPLESVALSDLGLFSALLLIGTILFVIIYLPHLVKRKKHHIEEELDNRDIISRIIEIVVNNKKITLFAIVVISLFLGYYSTKTSFDSNMSNINYLSREQQENMAYFRNLIQGINSGEENIYIVSSDSTLDAAINNSICSAKQIHSIVANDSSMHYTSCSKFITSTSEQAKRIDKWNRFVRKNSEKLLNDLQIYSEEYGFSNEAFEEFSSILTHKYPQSVNVSCLMPIFMSNFSADSINNRFSVINVISLPESKTDSVENILKGRLPSQYCFDIKSLNSSISTNLSDNFGYIGWACGLLVFIFLWVSFGRIETAILAFCPMAISWIWILGLMGLFDIHFNIVNVILATFIFGQGDDYTIFITEGCMYEYAYRKKMLGSYRRSIIISALIMFIGIGALIFAEHPALYSLAQVTIIGMFSVVFTSFIIPPIIFHCLTMKKNAIRRRPRRLLATLRTIYCGCIWLSQLAVGYLIAGIMWIFGCRSLRSRTLFHKMVSVIQRIDLKIIPGVKLNIENKYNEDFSKPCIIICNHQSMLDPAYLLSLNHKILIVGNEKSSLHPIVNGIFKWLNFYTVRVNNHKDWIDHCFERDIDTFREYINLGYSIAIFPEGVRNPKSCIVRYHKGPFYLAKELGVDILPILIHGVNHVMPIGSFEINSNPITMVIEKRITHNDILWSQDYTVTTKQIHKFYIEKYDQLAQQIETPDFYASLVKERYLYKGADILATVDKHFKQNGNYAQAINKLNLEKIIIKNCGYGELPILIALIYNKSHVIAQDSDENNLCIAKISAENIVNNIRFTDVLALENIDDAEVIELDNNGNII